MNEMIESMRAAIADGATPEQRTSGVHACRTLAAALEAEIGKPIPLPGVPAQSPFHGVSIDQALELVIARLRTAIDTRDKAPATAPVPSSPAPSPGLRIAYVPPMAPRAAGPRTAQRAQPARAGVGTPHPKRR